MVLGLRQVYAQYRTVVGLRIQRFLGRRTWIASVVLKILEHRSLIQQHVQCYQLRASFGAQISFPNSTVYNDQQNGTGGYWTQQEASVVPACRFAPKSTDDVSSAVAILSRSLCRFAIRGGGHMSWAGAANIQDGVTIDLALMKDVTVSSNNLAVSVGSGARWQDVYLKLDAMNISVVGGRVYDVGVGGLLLGGEISKRFLEPQSRN